MTAITGYGPGDSKPLPETVAGLLAKTTAITGYGPGDSRPLRVYPTVAGLLGERAAITGDGAGDLRPPLQTGAGLPRDRAEITGDALRAWEHTEEFLKELAQERGPTRAAESLQERALRKWRLGTPSRSPSPGASLDINMAESTARRTIFPSAAPCRATKRVHWESEE